MTFLQIRQHEMDEALCADADVIALTLSSVRLLSVWMAEETDALRQELYVQSQPHYITLIWFMRPMLWMGLLYRPSIPCWRWRHRRLERCLGRM